MKLMRWLVTIVVLVSLAGLTYWCLSSLPVSRGYSVEAEFSTLPDDDVQLERWLKASAGVVPHSVHVERVGAQNTIVRIFFIQSGNLRGEPGFPGLDQACHDLGYGSPKSTFHDSPGS